jgi:hypothetical protein
MNMGGLEGAPKPPGARRRPGEAGAPLDHRLPHTPALGELSAGILAALAPRSILTASNAARPEPCRRSWTPSA